MAMNLGDIVVSIKSDTSQLTKGFKRAETSVSKASRTMTTAVKTLTAAFIGLSAIDLVGNLVKQADAMTLINTRLKLATKSTEELVKAQKELFVISQEARVGFSSTVDLFERITRSTRDYATSQTEVIGLSETINKAMVISGGTATSMNAAIIQLGQAFSADFQAVGQELASIREQAPRLYQALLEGTKLSSKAFKKHAEDGKLSTQIIIEALKSQSESVETEFKKINLTVDQSQVQFSNSSLKMVGSIDDMTGASQFIAESISDISKSMDELKPEDLEDTVRQIKLITTTIIATTIAMKGYAATSALATSANALLGGSFGAVNRAILLTTISSKALSFAMKAIPIVAIAGGIALLTNSLFDSAKASDELEDSLSKTGKKLSELTENQLAYRKIVLDEELQKALMERQKAVADAAHQGFLESDKEHALDMKNKDEAIEKFREIREALLKVNTAIANNVIDPSSIETGAGGKKKPKTLSGTFDELDKAGAAFAKENADALIAIEEDKIARIKELQEQATLLITSDVDKINNKYLEMDSALDGIFDDSQMVEFYKAWQKEIDTTIEKQDKGNKESNKDLATQASAYASLASSIGSASGENENLRKAMELTAVVAGGVAILTQGEGDSYSAFARMAAMAVSVASILSSSGVSGGGGSVQSSPVSSAGSIEQFNASIATARDNNQAVGFDDFISGLESATSSLEAFGLSGEAMAVRVNALESEVKNAREDLMDQIRGWTAVTTEERAEAEFASLTSGSSNVQSDLADIFLEFSEQLAEFEQDIAVQGSNLETELAILQELDPVRRLELERQQDLLSIYGDNTAIQEAIWAEEDRQTALEESTKALADSAKLQSDIAKQVNQEMLGSLSYLNAIEKESFARGLFENAITSEDRISSARTIAEISQGTTRTREEFIPDFQRLISEIQNQADEATTQDVVDKLDEVIVALGSIESSATQDAIYAP